MILHSKKQIAILLSALFSASAMAADTVSTKISSGIFYSDGQSQTFGSPNSTMYSVPLMISISKGRFHSSLSTSYLDVKNHYPNNSSLNVEDTGLGDTTLSLGYDLTESPWLTAKVKYKFATGNKNKGLSTGKDDAYAQLDYFQPMSLKSSVFATVGYKFVGKLSGVAMQDSAYASLGAGYLLPSKTSVGVSLDYHQTTFTNLADQTGGSLFVSQTLNKQWSVSGFGSYDNTQTSSLGMTFTRKF